MQLRRAVILATAAHLGAVALIGWADYLLGPDLQLSVIYLVPIVTSALWWGRTPAVATALAGSTAWFINTEFIRPAQYGWEVLAWNGASRVVIYTVLALLVDRIRGDQLELRRVNRLRDEFLALVAHELRQPAAALSLITATLVDSAAEEDPERRLLLKLQEQARGLARLAGQLLAIGRLENGDLQLNLATTDLRQVAAEAVRESAMAERIELSVPSERLLVRGDPERLRQALDNLISNGLKYSPPAARVSVSLRCEDNTARVEVRDEGIGLAASELPLLFSKYARIARAETARVAGAGLGLYLTRTLVEAHGGRVAASSPGRGKGATFGITLPLANGAVESPEAHWL